MVMMSSTSIEKSFRIKHEDNNKFLSKLLSKENSKSVSSIPSFRVYYNDVPSSVPFTWELQPGTPKHTFSQTSLLPPLTPPPSYYSNNNNTNKKPTKNNSRSKIFHALIKKFNPKKSLLPPSPSYSSSSTLSWSSSSQYLSISAPTTPSHIMERRRFRSQGSFCDDYIHEEISPASKLCFGKKALFSIVGCRGSN
ncbi:uncharacterized protein LOC132057805 [Lycium ferocissimum]|uniref:uncharacterized protein LOC132057805 n=1 Tax=Lycium ferocissimum TaxID=112874 RepID=UPI0028168BE5|nr:uncharacterized protein LOC132057805 [Lycium ferocissimum]